MQDLIFIAKLYVTRFFKEGYYKYALAVIVYFFLKSYNEKSMQRRYDLIKENMSMGKAQLIDISPRNPKSGQAYRWKVYIDTFIINTSIPYKPGDDYLLEPGIWAPVVYLSGSPQTFEIIWNPYLFGRFNIPIPDSLEWAKNFSR